MQDKLTPNAVMMSDGRTYPVERVLAHPPGQHPAACPLRRDVTAVELVTAAGSRWYGCEQAWIGPDLRMHVSGFPERFEEMAAWRNAPAGMPRPRS